MLRRLLNSLIWIACLALLVYFFPFEYLGLEDPAFQDVPKDHINYDAVKYISSNDIMAGYKDERFRPEQEITRAELIKIIVSTLFQTEGSEKDCYADVKDEWFATYVCFARGKNIIEGEPESNFRPTENIAFSEAAKILVLGYGIEYDEKAEGEWWETYVAGLAGRKAIPINIESVDTLLTRGHVAEIIYRLQNAVTDLSTHTVASLKGEEDPIIVEKIAPWYERWEIFKYLGINKKQIEIVDRYINK